MAGVPEKTGATEELSALLIDEALDIAEAYGAKRPANAPPDLTAAALALAEEVRRLRSVVGGGA